MGGPGKYWMLLMILVGGLAAAVVLAQERERRQPPESAQAPESTQAAESAQAAETDARAHENAMQGVRYVYQLDQIGITLGRVAQERGTSLVIQRYGRLIAADHARSLRVLNIYLRHQDLSLPPANSNSNEQIAIDNLANQVDRLKTLSGKEFDEQFLRTAVRASEQSLSTLEMVDRLTPTPYMYEKLSALLPILRQDLDIANGLTISR